MDTQAAQWNVWREVLENSDYDTSSSDPEEEDEEEDWEQYMPSQDELIKARELFRDLVFLREARIKNTFSDDDESKVSPPAALGPLVGVLQRFPLPGEVILHAWPLCW